MSSQDSHEDTDKENHPEMDADQSDDSVATKLSEELNNWRRRRTTSRSRRNESDGASSNSHSQSESARTIRVRGHETLVIRKPKMVVKPSNSADRSHE
jgi:hypothetical protein